MRIGKNMVVSLSFKALDTQGGILDESTGDFDYLHGGYHGIFPKIEEALTGQEAGFEYAITLEPEDAFGEYDASLVKMEPQSKFPSELEIGAEFEAVDESGQEADVYVYRVTDIADGQVVLDANHPLAGESIRFECRVLAVRPATPEEIDHGHVHSGEGHVH